jgi:hypothetical protein
MAGDEGRGRGRPSRDVGIRQRDVGGRGGGEGAGFKWDSSCGQTHAGSVDEP